MERRSEKTCVFGIVYAGEYDVVNTDDGFASVLGEGGEIRELISGEDVAGC